MLVPGGRRSRGYVSSVLSLGLVHAPVVCVTRVCVHASADVRAAGDEFSGSTTDHASVRTPKKIVLDSSRMTAFLVTDHSKATQ